MQDLSVLMQLLRSDGLVEILANVEHERWSKWMRYQFSHGIEATVVSRPAIDRWRRQMDTDYADLSEQEKESDRKEARITLQTIRNHLANATGDE